MKKLLAIVVLGLLCCSTSFAELKPVINLSFEKCRMDGPAGAGVIKTAWIDRDRQSVFYIAKKIGANEFFRGYLEIDNYDENYISTKDTNYLYITPEENLEAVKSKKVEKYMSLKLTLLIKEKRMVEEHTIKKPTNKKDLKKLNKLLDLNDSNYPHKLHAKHHCDTVVVKKDSKPKAVAKKPETVAKKPISNHTKEDLRYTLLTYGLKIDNEMFVFKFNKDESGVLKSKMNVWYSGAYKEEITEDKIFWTIENENKFSFRKIGRDKKNFVVLDFKNRLAKVNLDKSNFEGKIGTPQEIVKAGTKEKQITKKPKKKITTTPDIDTSLITIGSGSGFYINNKGYALTNNHVIDICAQSIAVIDGKETLFRVIATDKTNDVAVLKTDYKSRNFIKINEDGAKLGENVIAVGYPLAGRLSDSVKITRGIVSSLSGLANNIGQIQIDAALQPGNSGGPVLNENGELVGIASAGLNKLLMAKEAKYIPENVNFAVASPIVVNILKSKKVKYTTPSIFGGSFSNTELAELGDSSTIQLFCRNTRTAYNKLKRSKKYSTVLLDLD